jgi:ribosome modulation factor
MDVSDFCANHLTASRQKRKRLIVSSLRIMYQFVIAGQSKGFCKVYRQVYTFKKGALARKMFKNSHLNLDSLFCKGNRHFQAQIRLVRQNG